MKHLFAPRIGSISVADDADAPRPERTVDNRVEFAAKYRRHVLRPGLIHRILTSALPGMNQRDDMTKR